MKAILRIDAAPGYEGAVEDAVADIDGVFGVVREKVENNDLVAAVRTDDADGLRAVESAIRHETGVQGLERELSPDQDLLDRFAPG